MKEITKLFHEPVDWQDYSDIPQFIKDTLENYNANRWDPGGFITA